MNDEARVYLVLLAIVAAALLGAVVLLVRQRAELDAAEQLADRQTRELDATYHLIARLRGRIRARREHCEQMHVGELAALVEVTRPITFPSQATNVPGLAICPRSARGRDC